MTNIGSIQVLNSNSEFIREEHAYSFDIADVIPPPTSDMGDDADNDVPPMAETSYRWFRPEAVAKVKINTSPRVRMHGWKTFTDSFAQITVVPNESTGIQQCKITRVEANVNNSTSKLEVSIVTVGIRSEYQPVRSPPNATG